MIDLLREEKRKLREEMARLKHLEIIIRFDESRNFIIILIEFSNLKFYSDNMHDIEFSFPIDENIELEGTQSYCSKVTSY
jgi:hypothetical protein